MPEVQLIINNIDTKIIGQLDSGVLDLLSSTLMYKTTEYTGFKHIEIENRMFNRKPRTFPTGLYSLVEKVLNDNDVDFTIVDRRQIKHSSVPIKLKANLRDYQETIVNDAVNNQRFIIQVATGGGKTVIASAIIARLNVKTLFLVHTGDLFEQAYDELTRFLGVPIGRIGGGICDIKDINVCMIQTLHSVIGEEYKPFDEIEKEVISSEKFKNDNDAQKLGKSEAIRNFIDSVECVIIDECHHLQSTSYINTMRACKNSFYKGGLSATPFRGDGRDMVLQAYAGKTIGKITASYLIKAGWLVKPTIYYLRGTPNKDFKFEKKKYNKIYKKHITDSKYRNEKIVDCVSRLVSKNLTILITVTTKKHGALLLEMINQNFPDISVEFIFSGVKKSVRKEHLDSMRRRELSVIIGTSLADEGLDIPTLDSLILAGGGKSATRMIQRVGRVLRKPTDGKKTGAIVIDFKDNVRYLLGHYKVRRTILESEPEFEIIEALDD